MKKKILPKKLIEILKEYQPEKIILFGSWAFGKPTRIGDIDLCLLKKLNQPAFIEKRFLWKLLWDRGYDFKIEPDLHLYDVRQFNKRLKMDDPFIQEIAKGKILHENKKA